MTTLATKLLNAYFAKLYMKTALENKTEEPVNVPLSDYAEIVRSLEKDNTTMEDIEGIRVKKVKIPSGTTKIGPYAFAYNSELGQVIVPKSVVQCDYNAFLGSEGANLHAPVIFKDMTFSNPVLVSEYTTSGQADGTYISTDSNEVTWQYSVTNEMATITKLSTGCTAELEIPPFFADTPVRSIGTGALSGQSMYTINIPHTITSIDSYALSGCPNLSSVDIPDSMISVGVEAFSYCQNLHSAKIPKTVSSFGTMIFANCTNLLTLNLEEGLSSLGTAMCLSSGLASVFIPSSIRSGVFGYMLRGFESSKSLTSFSAPSLSVFNAPRCLAGCSSLKNLYIPKVETLGIVFGNTAIMTTVDKLSSLTELTLPSIKTIASTAFGLNASNQYTAITDLYIPNKSYEEIVKMDNYASWYLAPDCVIHGRDRNFYYDLSLNTYHY